jgi:hypothetical protein
MNKQLIFATLGPSGTCHERATKAYIAFQELLITLENIRKCQHFSQFLKRSSRAQI